MRKCLLIAVLALISGQVWAADIVFEDTSLEAFVKLISRRTGVIFLYDANDTQLKQQFKITARGIKEESLHRLFESVLEMRGYTLIEFPDFTKIVKIGESVPSDSAIITSADIEGLKHQEKLVTMFFKLNYISAQEMLSVLNQVKSRMGRVIKVEDTSLILYDYSDNINKMIDIVKAMDVKPQIPGTRVIQLKYAQAQDLQGLMSKIFPPGRSVSGKPAPGGHAAGRQTGIKIYADRRLNALIVSGFEHELAELDALVSRLDIEPAKEQTEIHIIALKNGDAEDIAKKLQDVYADKQKRTKGAGGAANAALDKIPSIVPHEGTNSIIVISPPDVFQELQTIIDLLDKKKDKVLIEALIVELSYDQLHDFGIELSSVHVNPDEDYNVYGGALFGMSSIGFDPAAGVTRVPQPSNVSGLMGGVTYKNNYSQLPLLIIAAREDKNVSIQAMPKIVANDNEEAFFESSVQVPTLKTNIGSGGEIISQSSEYHTAAMKLQIVPHITEEDYLRLEIEQDSERFDLATALVNLPPAKTSRKTKTTVTIPDGTTVLLGGLESEDGSWQIKKVPLLGDLPLLRHLFRRKTWTESDDTVFVFITAHIIRSDEDYQLLSQQRLDQIERMKKKHREYTGQRRKEGR